MAQMVAVAAAGEPTIKVVAPTLREARGLSVRAERCAYDTVCYTFFSSLSDRNGNISQKCELGPHNVKSKKHNKNHREIQKIIKISSKSDENTQQNSQENSKNHQNLIEI